MKVPWLRSAAFAQLPEGRQERTERRMGNELLGQLGQRFLALDGRYRDRLEAGLRFRRGRLARVLTGTWTPPESRSRRR
jgi:hypothetical protein